MFKTTKKESFYACFPLTEELFDCFRFSGRSEGGLGLRRKELCLCGLGLGGRSALQHVLQLLVQPLFL